MIRRHDPHHLSATYSVAFVDGWRILGSLLQRLEPRLEPLDVGPVGRDRCHNGDHADCKAKLLMSADQEISGASSPFARSMSGGVPTTIRERYIVLGLLRLRVVGVLIKRKAGERRPCDTPVAMWPGNPLQILREIHRHLRLRREILYKAQFFWASESKY